MSRATQFGTLRSIDSGKDVTSACIVKIDGTELLCLGGKDGILRLRNPTTGRVLRSSSPAVSSITCSIVAGELIWTGCSDAVVRLWNPNGLELAASLLGHSGAILSLSAIDSDLVATAAADTTLRLWHTSTHACLRVIHTARRIRCIALAPNHKLWFGDDEHGVSCWGVRDRAPRAVGSHAQAVLACVYVPWAAEVWTAGKDRVIRVWDALQQTFKRELRGHAAAVTALSTYNSFVISASADHSVRIWSTIAGATAAPVSIGGPAALSLSGIVSSTPFATPAGPALSALSTTAASALTAAAAAASQTLLLPGESIACLCVLTSHTGWVTHLLTTSEGVWSVGSDRTARLHGLLMGGNTGSIIPSSTMASISPAATAITMSRTGGGTFGATAAAASADASATGRTGDQSAPSALSSAAAVAAPLFGSHYSSLSMPTTGVVGGNTVAAIVDTAAAVRAAAAATVTSPSSAALLSETTAPTGRAVPTAPFSATPAPPGVVGMSRSTPSATEADRVYSNASLLQQQRPQEQPVCYQPTQQYEIEQSFLRASQASFHVDQSQEVMAEMRALRREMSVCSYEATALRHLSLAGTSGLTSHLSAASAAKTVAASAAVAAAISEGAPVAVLCARVPSATELASRLGERLVAPLAAYCSIVRSVALSNSGLEVDSVDDALTIVFAQPLAAVVAALEIHAKLASHTWTPSLRLGPEGLLAATAVSVGRAQFERCPVTHQRMILVGNSVTTARLLCQYASEGQSLVSVACWRVCGDDVMAVRRVTVRSVPQPSQSAQAESMASSAGDGCMQVLPAELAFRRFQLQSSAVHPHTSLLGQSLSSAISVKSATATEKPPVHFGLVSAHERRVSEIRSAAEEALSRAQSVLVAGGQDGTFCASCGSMAAAAETLAVDALAAVTEMDRQHDSGEVLLLRSQLQDLEDQLCVSLLDSAAATAPASVSQREESLLWEQRLEAATAPLHARIREPDTQLAGAMQQLQLQQQQQQQQQEQRAEQERDADIALTTGLTAATVHVTVTTATTSGTAFIPPPPPPPVTPCSPTRVGRPVFIMGERRRPHRTLKMGKEETAAAAAGTSVETQTEGFALAEQIVQTESAPAGAAVSSAATSPVPDLSSIERETASIGTVTDQIRVPTQSTGTATTAPVTATSEMQTEAIRRASAALQTEQDTLTTTLTPAAPAATVSSVQTSDVAVVTEPISEMISSRTAAAATTATAEVMTDPAPVSPSAAISSAEPTPYDRALSEEAASLRQRVAELQRQQGQFVDVNLKRLRELQQRTSELSTAKAELESLRRLVGTAMPASPASAMSTTAVVVTPSAAAGQAREGDVSDEGTAVTAATPTALSASRPDKLTRRLQQTVAAASALVADMDTCAASWRSFEEPALRVLSALAGAAISVASADAAVSTAAPADAPIILHPSDAEGSVLVLVTARDPMPLLQDTASAREYFQSVVEAARRGRARLAAASCGEAFSLVFASSAAAGDFIDAVLSDCAAVSPALYATRISTKSTLPTAAATTAAVTNTGATAAETGDTTATTTTVAAVAATAADRMPAAEFVASAWATLDRWPHCGALIDRQVWTTGLGAAAARVLPTTTTQHTSGGAEDQPIILAQRPLPRGAQWMAPVTGTTDRASDTEAAATLPGALASLARQACQRVNNVQSQARTVAEAADSALQLSLRAV